MASRRLQRQYAFVLSVLGHAAIVALLTFSIPLANRNREAAGPNVVPIDTYLIDESAVAEEVARLEAAETERQERERLEAERIQQQQEAEQRELERIQQERVEAEQAAERERLRIQREAEEEQFRLAELERQREEAERVAEQERLERERQEEIARQEELERQRQEAERQRQEQLAREREEAERQRREAEERARVAAAEAEVQESLAREREARLARESGLVDEWSRRISSKVQLSWNRPATATVGLECRLLVTQLLTGRVVEVEVESCNTNDQVIIRSVENAVLSASPLPERPRGVPFESQVRITFRPTD